MSYPFIDACFRRPVDRVPAWIMRQAGRYLPTYMAMKEHHTFWEMCTTPELAAQVTMLPFEVLDLDAAILFSDILAPIPAMGRSVEFKPGPVLARPVRTRADVDELIIPDPRIALPWQAEAVRACVKALDGRVPLIGFAASPFTLGAYVVEGSGSKSFAAYKGLVYGDPKAYDNLMHKLTETLIAVLNAQLDAGAQAIQVFESWASLMGPEDWQKRVLPWVHRLIEGVRREGVPIIYYANGASGYQELLVETGADVIGVDWRIDLAEARALLGDDVAVQGNLDPTALFAPEDELVERVLRLVKTGASTPGYIFNLGHGILPQADPARVKAAIDAVHSVRPGSA